MTNSDNLPDERSSSSPSPDAGRPVLDSSMPPAWRQVYDMIREAHAMAVIEEQAARRADGGAEAAAILRASTAAVKAFRGVYEEESTAAIARQIVRRDGA